jgi:redox-sensitive bicupin YhaK (pirin superfamily)
VNASSEQPVAFLQIWVLPEQENILPRYQQMNIQRQRRNEWIPLVAPDNPAALLINQQCWMQMLNADAGTVTTYQLKNPHNGAYFFVISGSLTINGQMLHERDAAGWVANTPFSLQAASTACVLCIEVPF